MKLTLVESQMNHPGRRIERRLVAAAGLVALLALLAIVSCGDHSTEPDVELADLPSVSAVISNPIATAAAGQTSGTVYVSMPPGTVATGEHVQIRNASTGFLTATLLVDGGFDPVGVPALVGHTLIVSVLHGDRVTARTELVVEPKRPPTVVRTSPAAKKRDVPLNAVIVVVFSEPIDTATLDTTSVRLVHGGADVSGTLSVSHPVALTAEFRPAALLIPEAAYTLVVSGAVSDQDGDKLGTPVTVDFTTQGPSSGTLSIVDGDNQSGTVGGTLARLLQVSVRHDGTGLEGVTVRWACSDCVAGSGAPTVTPESVTDTAGIASAAVTLGNSTGTWHIDADIGTAAVRFVVHSVTPHTMLMVSGDTQSDTVLAGLADPLLVRVVRAGDVPAAGVAVRWVAIDGGASGTFIESGSATATTLTGDDGLASVRLVLGGSAGHVQVQASLPDLADTQPIWFNASARAGNVVSLAIDSVQTFFSNVGLVSLTGVSLSPFHVIAADAHGNSVAAQSLDWSVVSGTGVVTPLPGSSSAIGTPLADGPLVVSASAPGLTPVTFTGHGVAATILTVGATDGDCEEGSFMPRTVDVTANRWVGWTICWNDSTEDGWDGLAAWRWTYEHDVTFEDGVVTWPSTAGTLENWGPHFRVFTTPGTYRFRCTRHSSGFDPDDGETGVVIVR